VIPLRWKIYALAALAFGLALLGWRQNAVSRALESAAAERLRRDVAASTKARERDAELHAMDDASLADRAHEWVRPPSE
jgi:hypothetical protein